MLASNAVLYIAVLVSERVLEVCTGQNEMRDTAVSMGS